MVDKKANRKNVKRQPKKVSVSFRAIARVFKVGCAVIMIGGAIGVSVYYGGKAVNQFLSKPINQVVVEGSFEYISQSSLEKMISQNIQQSFIRESLHSIQQKIQENPWVDNVVLRRQWPDQLYVVVTEQRPIARWGKEGFVNYRGELIKVDDGSKIKDLPVLNGNEKEALTIMKQYQLLSQTMAPFGISVVELEENQLGSWQVRLSNGWNLLAGRTDVVKKVQRLMQLWSENKIPQTKPIKMIDMRYQNGLAIRWHDEEQHAKRASLKNANSSKQNI